jgi:gas vesicle protein
VEEKPLEPINIKRGSLVVPILAGGIIGAGIALLLAPKSGSETRADLKQFASTAGDKVASAIDKGKDLYVAGKGAITEAVVAGKKAYIEEKEEILRAV